MSQEKTGTKMMGEIKRKRKREKKGESEEN